MVSICWILSEVLWGSYIGALLGTSWVTYILGVEGDWGRGDALVEVGTKVGEELVVKSSMSFVDTI